MSSSGPVAAARRVFARVTGTEARYVADVLRTETVGGALLLASAVIALVWANSPWRDGYQGLLTTPVGPLDVAHWAADGLLAVFFFVAGLELKRELVDGDLRDPAKALLPVVAALSGVAVPALVYLAVTSGDPSARPGWAIPVATDIAFALAVLAVLGTHLPSALRSFLLTLAVVDDLVAITIIAVAFTAKLALLPLLAALVPLALFGFLVQRGITRWWLLAPLATATWWLVHASGVHATVAGVLLAFTVPVRDTDLGEDLEHRIRPFSAGVAVPLFALTAAGVTISGADSLTGDVVVAGIVVALVAGKAVGVFLGAWLTARFTRAELDDSVSWSDVAGVALLSGMGFTVSLLIGELAFGTSGERSDHVKVAVLLGSLLSALAAAVVLVRRNRHYRALEEAEA